MHPIVVALIVLGVITVVAYVVINAYVNWAYPRLLRFFTRLFTHERECNALDERVPSDTPTHER